MLTDLRGHCCGGLGMPDFGLWGMIGQFSESGSVVVGSSVQIAAAIIANSIKSVREVSNAAKPD